MVASPEGRLIALWQRLGGSAAGRSIFSWMLRYFVPYSGNSDQRFRSREQ